MSRNRRARVNKLVAVPGLVPGIHVFNKKIVDGRDKPGHDKLRDVWIPASPV